MKKAEKKPLTEKQYNKLVLRQEKATKENDYSKLIMRGDENDLAMREYFKKNICKHESIEELQGGQIEFCRLCGKTWG
jgi:hypothetical protein